MEPPWPFAKGGESVLNFKDSFLRMVTYMLSLFTFRRRRVVSTLTLALLAGALLCLPGGAAPGTKKGANKKTSSVPSLSAVIQSPTLTIGDPKLPGKLLAVVKAGGFSGSSADQSALGTMTQVHALLYRQGKPAATFDAPRAHVTQNSATKNVVAVGTGGVTVVSLTEPGTRLTADVVTWYASLNRIVATGHVVYHNAKTGWDLQAPTMTADTQLRSVSGGKGRAFGKY